MVAALVWTRGGEGWGVQQTREKGFTKTLFLKNVGLNVTQAWDGEGQQDGPRQRVPVEWAGHPPGYPVLVLELPHSRR